MIDLRLPVGIFFFIVGVILTITGLTHPVHTSALSFSLNLGWGIILLIFGALMTVFGWIAERHGVTSGGATDDSPV
jgi:hypothetical protein